MTTPPLELAARLENGTVWLDDLSMVNEAETDALMRAAALYIREREGERSKNRERMAVAIGHHLNNLPSGQVSLPLAAHMAQGFVWGLVDAALEATKDGESAGLQPLEKAKWAGDRDVIGVGWDVEVLASDPLPGDVIKGHQLPRMLGRTACWIRCQMPGSERFVYRSCDLCDLELSDDAFDRLSALPARPCCDGGPQWGHAWDCPKVPG